MRHYSVKITQGGRYIEFDAISTSSSQALMDALAHISGDEPFAIMVSGSEVLNG